MDRNIDRQKDRLIDRKIEKQIYSAEVYRYRQIYRQIVDIDRQIDLINRINKRMKG